MPAQGLASLLARETSVRDSIPACRNSAACTRALSHRPFANAAAVLLTWIIGDDHARSMTTNFPVLGMTHAIEIGGEDARRFAQAQFAGDVESLDAERWQWNAWLTPVGKVRALMHLVDAGDDRVLMLLRGGDTNDLLAQLQHYVLRARVKLAAREFVARAGGPLPAGHMAADAETVILGYGSRSLRLDTATALPVDASAGNAWRLADIHDGWPTLPPGEPEFLPPALGLERLGAITFDKGCYPGQEIAARLHFRGGHKRSLCHLRGQQGLPLGPIRAPDGSQAWVLDAAMGSGGWDALAVLSDIAHNEINIMDNVYHIVSNFGS